VLSIENLHVAYGKVEAVRGVSLTAVPGQITLVLGINGAGKTTTLRATAGLLPLVAGEISLDGQRVTGLRPYDLVRRGLTLVPEGRKVFGPLTVAENLRLGGYTSKDQADTLGRIYDMFPVLKERTKSPAGLLSGGEQQMLAFARALMSQPKYILMDEPSMGLAPAMVSTVLSKVRTMADEGIGVIMVEQNADVGLDMSESVVVMARGEIVLSETGKQAKSHPGLLRAFLGEAALTQG
jgi:branched-chain amino acid transport system ATP-binding protein